MDELKVGFIQTSLEWENPQGNLANLEEEIKNIASKVDLIVLPEMFSTGFTMNASTVAEEPQGNSFSWMMSIAKTHDIAITGSLVTKDGGEYFNRLYFVLPDGQFYSYDKRHTFTLAGEDKVYSRGKDKLIVDYKGWKICPLICYDLRFPVWSRNTEDYDLLIYVANWPSRRVKAWDVLLKARAIENMTYCIGVNRTGKDGNEVEYPGHSMIYDGLGEALLDYDWENPYTGVVILQKEHLQKIRGSLRFLQDRDSFTIT